MNSKKLAVLSVLASALGVSGQYTATYDPNNLPPTTERDQIGTNQCGTANNDTSLCQNLYVNNIKDFCLWGAQEPNSVIGNIEQIVVAYCSQPGRGTRLFKDGTLNSAHFVETPDYIQITGTGNFVNINIAPGDAGGELDPHGPDGLGNPHGGLVFTNHWNNGTNGLGEQIHEWTNFMSVNEYCIRVCKEGPRAAMWCEHIYDVTGCKWNMPGNYEDGFTSCKGDSGIPMGLYPQADGSTSTFHQGEPATPPPHPAPSVSACQTYESSVLYATATPTPTTTVSSTGSRPNSSGPAPTNSGSTGAAVQGVAAMPLVMATSLLGFVVTLGIIF
ncbi:hypothetical protein CPB86DRAFT_787890 [Serendipita vermifera]|nr:hypothetical protein CPB86DRAFT_787890 [Serendipita vermifera]